MRLAGHSLARITRSRRRRHRLPVSGRSAPQPASDRQAWTLSTVAAILGNPRYTGRQVWNRQRTDKELIDPASTGLGHRQVQRWTLPEGWIISTRPARLVLGLPEIV